VRGQIIGGMGHYINLMGALLFGSSDSPMRAAPPRRPQYGEVRKLSAGDELRLRLAGEKRERRRAKVIAEGRCHGR
jgi:hypothetical protein